MNITVSVDEISLDTVVAEILEYDSEAGETRPAALSADASRTSSLARLDQARARLREAGWTARVVTETADERAERLADYGLEA